MKDKHTSKNHASFTPQRQNKYSIRKFTFGTASILVGATLFLGVNHDAKAAENVPTSTEISTTPDPGQEVEQAHADEVAFEAEVLNDSVVKTDEESTTVKKEEIQEEGGQVENTSLPENQPSNENTEKAVEEKHLEPKVQNAAPKSENVQVSKEKVSVPQPTIVKETEETNKIDLNSAIKIDQVKDLETATNFYAQSAGVSIADAKEFIKDLNLKESITPAELQQALIYQLSLEYETMYHPVAVIEGTERKDVKIIDGQRTTNYAAPLTINNPDVILADAMLNGYVSSGSDELSKAHLISGRAWMTDQGIPSVGTNGLTPVPVNTPVFLQWMDRDGAISPIYLAYTHNRNNDDSAQDGPGGYAFDLRNGWTDAKGKKHLYSAFAGQKYRFAIPDFTLPNGNRATMLRQSGGFYPGVFVDTFTINNMGQTPVVGKNIGRTGIFMAEVPVGNYMTKPKNQWVEANGNHSDPGILAIDGYNIVRGRVWMESSGGDRSNSATGPNFNPNMGDKAANGYKVVFSSLTTQGASAYRNAVERLPEDQRATAAKRLLQDHPEYISATVVATTDSSGVYAAKFPSGTLNVEHIYGFVLNPKGKLVQTYSGFTSPEFRRANQNIEIAPIAAPYSGIQQWANVNFAVVLSPSDTIDIATKPYNATNNPAAPGNRVEVELTNGDVPPMPTHIEWRDKNGNVVSKSRDFTTPKEGEKVGGFTIPNNAEEGDTYTAVLVSGGNDIGGDTVVVHVTDSNKYPPKATVVNKAFGQPTNENDVISHVTFPNYPANHKKPNVVVDHPDQLPDGSVPGRVEVPVTVTYPDGSTATIKVPVVTADQQDKDKYQPTTESIEKNYGEKATPDEVKGKVTVPNFPANGKQPTYTVDEAKIPNGLKSGTENVPVTVTYPDGSKEVVEVPVITKEQLDKDKYQPTTEEIRKPFGQRTDENEVKSKVAIPGYPENGQPVTITVDTSKIPDGQTPGEVNVPVTVTYPDNTTDVVNVKVTTGPKDSDTYQPTTAPITKPYGQGTTEQEIKDKVTVPNFPKDGVQPKVVIDDPTKVPDGNTTGVFDVPVTVTYPDGTTDKVTVKVTVGKQADNAKYEPTAEDITKKFGQKATPDEVKGKVTVPGFPKEGNQPVLTVDESKIPNGQTPGEVNVPVTVTYPDKTTDVVNVKVTTGPKDSDTYQPTTTPITKPYGQGTTEQEVKDKVTVPNFPKDGIQPKVVIDDPTKVPDGNTTGVFDVPVTVTYPDGTTDKTSVKVTVGKQADNAKYDPKAGEITKKFGQKATPDEVKGKVTVPGFPKDGDQPVLTVDETKIPNGQTPGEVNVPVTVTYPDKTTDVVNVKVTTGPKDSDTYQPTTEPITKPYGQGTTEQEVKDKVTVPNFPKDGVQPKVVIDDPTKVPDGNTTGVFDVPVTVTYPDGTTDKVTVKVIVGKQADNAKYDPKVGEITKKFGQKATPDEVKGKVTMPGFPKDGDQPVLTVDETKIPDGQTPGEVNVPVTVTYPDHTTDVVNVKVTTGPKDSDTYQPTTEPITKPYGQGTTEQEVKDKVTVPNFPKDGVQPKVVIDDPTKVPDGNTTGVFDVPVTVTYPDGTTDKVTVKVTVGKQADNAKYEPTTEPITKPYGQGTTEQEVKDKVTVPNFPAGQDQPTVTVDDPTKIPDGQTTGVFDVPVTVTYPDGTTDKVTVKVTVGKQADNAKYEPTTEPITKPYGQGTTEQEIKDKVTVPNFPKDGVQPKVTVDDPTKVPDGNTTGVFDVPVTVTYPDGTTDKVTVKVTVGKQADNAKYDPKAGEITKKFGQKATPDEVKGKVTVPGFPKDGDQPVLTVDETKIPDGQTPGEVNVPVTVTYPDHTTDVVNVKVTTGPKDSDTYQPTTEPITKPYGQGTTEQEVKDKVTVPNFPAGQDQPTVTVDDPTKVPAGQTTGVFDVPVTVTYPDGTTDKVTVKVTVNPQPENEQYEPIAKEVEKSYGQPTTPGDVVSQVTVPGYPTTGEQPKVSIDDPTSLPNGQTPGEYDIPVTVTYPDGTKDHVTVHVIVKPQPDTDIYVPSYNDVKVNPGQSVEVPQTGDKVPVGSTFEIIGNSAGGNGWTATIDPHTGTVKVTAPKDAHEGDKVIVKVLVHYPDGTTDNIGVHVTVHDSIAPEAPVINPIEAGSKVVTGTGKEPGTTVAVTFPNGEVVTTTVDNNGNWKVDVPNNITLTHGDKVIAVITDEAGNVSERTEQPVKDTICPEAPKVNVIHNGDKEISGTAEPGTTVTVTFPDGSTASSLVDENGHYTVKVPNHVTLKADDKVTAIATDEAGNVSKVTTAVVVGDKEGVPTPSGSKVEKAPAKRISNNQDRIDKQSSVTKGQNSDKVSEKATSAKVEKAENKSAQTTRDKALPETGNAENTSSGILVGGLFALLGSLLLFRKRQNKNEKKNN